MSNVRDEDKGTQEVIDELAHMNDIKKWREYDVHHELEAEVANAMLFLCFESPPQTEEELKESVKNKADPSDEHKSLLAALTDHRWKHGVTIKSRAVEQAALQKAIGQGFEQKVQLIAALEQSYTAESIRNALQFIEDADPKFLSSTCWTQECPGFVKSIKVSMVGWMKRVCHSFFAHMRLSLLKWSASENIAATDAPPVAAEVSVFVALQTHDTAMFQDLGELQEALRIVHAWCSNWQLVLKVRAGGEASPDETGDILSLADWSIMRNILKQEEFTELGTEFHKVAEGFFGCSLRMYYLCYSIWFDGDSIRSDCHYCSIGVDLGWTRFRLDSI